MRLFSLALLLAAVRAAPVPAHAHGSVNVAARLDPIGVRPKIDDFMRRTADGMRRSSPMKDNETMPSSSATGASPDSDSEHAPTVQEYLNSDPIESGTGWAVVVQRGCRLFLCL
ncbi:hypothetical protein C8R43DRAFT_1140684 [Mycena crocata]|nr:hypothetical protein C8R43DRAFT_1140684 [Mycena crocata]